MLFTKDFWKDLYHHFIDDDVVGMSAQLSYFFLLSLFPFLIFLLTLIGFMPIPESSVFNIIYRYFPSDSMDLIVDNINQLMANRNGGLLSFGLILTIWSASNGINALVRVFNRAYETEEDRSFIVTRLISIVMTIAMILVLAVALALPVFGREIGDFIFTILGYSESFIAFWNVFRWILSFVIIIFVLTILYILAPNKEIKLRHAIPGAFVATTGWQLTSLGFSFYVENLGNFSYTYGSLGGMIVLLIWLFLSGMMLIIGGEVNAILERHKERLLFK
ncbi:YihY/virulence factor BrkB family protein [Tenuibacillus multivorans]|uniref:Membrane protein n=1 Tax=Tenuibacillus multivorans TaxID=237069 RepID=A0A1H0G0E8_9BACI|nr:YihY/virulence factor BrkB family protein [Tenuibacillus multivorans]GEL78134.1 putative ribonuclease-like protein YfkH [Tenuibacillus multivorans]SDO00340.1 membrane protein [Tenuibacillus multivorans]